MYILKCPMTILKNHGAAEGILNGRDEEGGEMSEEKQSADLKQAVVADVPEIYSNNVQIFSPNDKGSFSEILRVSLPNDLAITTPEIFSIETADLNGNGILDIAVSTHELFVLFQNRSIPGTFASPIRIAGQR